MKKKIISLLLALVMLFSMIPMSAITALAAGEPTVISNVGISGAPVPIAGQNAEDYLDAESVYPYAPGKADAIETEIDSWYQGEISDFNIDPPTPFTGDFVAGEKYFLVMWISAKDGYIYDDELDIFAFGSDSVIYKRFDETIATVAINYTAAVAKSDEAVTAVDVEMPPFSKGDVVSAASYPLETDNENVLATVSFYQGSTGEPVDPSVPYFLGILLDAKDGYVFDEPTVTINGKEYAVESSYSDQAVPNVYSVAFEITDLLTPITVTGIPAPVVGQTVDQWGNSITEEPFMSGPVTWAGAPVWLEGEFDDYNDAMLELYEGAGPFTGTFQDNQHYTLCNFVLSKEEGYVPASATVIAAGTSKATYESLEKYESEGAMIYLTYTFGTPAEKELISSVNLTMPEVAAGTAPTAADVTIDGATCTVKEMEWISPVSYEDTYTILENDKVYRLCLELTPADGYKFSAKNPPAFTINGKKVEIDYDLTYQGGYYAEILFRLGTPTPYCIDFRVDNGASGEYFWEFGSVDYVLPECPYTHSTKEFGGWEIDDVVYQPGDTIQLTKDVSAYPVWKDPAPVTVSFDKNGGSGTMADQSVAKGGTYTLPSCSFTAPSYKQFKCWSVGGVEKQVGNTITVTADTTVVAVWENKSYSVAISGNNFTHNGEATAKYDTDYQVTLTPADGYRIANGGVTVKVNGYTIYDWTIDYLTGVVTIPGKDITGNVSISVTSSAIIAGASGTATSALNITDNSGNQTVISTDADASGVGYTYDHETNTLTLNNWSGRQIVVNGDLNIHLKGTNTLTMVDTEDSTIRGIYASAGVISFTADEGAVLNVTGTGLTQDIVNGINSGLLIYNGTINVNLTGGASSYMYGTYGDITFAQYGKQAATLNVRVENTEDDATALGSSGSLSIANSTNDITLNAEAYSTGEKALANGLALHVYNTDAKVTFTADSTSEELLKNVAHERMINSIQLLEGGKVTFNGLVANYYSSIDNKKNTYTTTPANDLYLWYKDASKINETYYNYMFDVNLDPITKAVFEYSATPVPFAYTGTNAFKIKSVKVGESVGNNYIPDYLVGHSGNGNISCEILEGTLPQGVGFDYYNRNIGGTPTEPCAAGQVTLKVTDNMGTKNDATDDKSLTIVVPYGEVIEEDKFISVDGCTPFNMKTDGSGTGWTYDGTTKTLTLNNYNGGVITAEKDLNLHLKGTNTITLPASGESTVRGIYLSSGVLTVTADEGAVLNVTGTNLTQTVVEGISSDILIYNGTINVNLKGNVSAYIRGTYGDVTFAENETRAATLNVRVENTGADDAIALGSAGSLEISNTTNDITLNAEAYSAGGKALANGLTLSVYNTAAKVTFTGESTSEELLKSVAHERTIYSIQLLEGGKVTFNGLIANYYSHISSRKDTYTTTPANDMYIWHQDTSKINDDYYSYMFDVNIEPITKAVFEYSATPVPFAYTGTNAAKLKSVKVGEKVNSVYIPDYLVGLTGAGNISCEILEGAFPQGVGFDYYNRSIGGTPTEPCAAGQVTLKVTDNMGTKNDATDDKSLTVVVPYGAVTSTKPVTALALDKDVLVLTPNSSGEILASVTPSDAAFPRVTADESATGIVCNVSEPVNGVSTITVKSKYTPGIYTVIVTTVDMGLKKTFTVYVKEATPEITMVANENRLKGFTNGATYKITAEGCEDYTFTATEYYLELKPEWIGKTLNIIRVNAEANCNSDPQILSITTKTVTVTKGTGSGDYIVGDIVTVTADEAPVGYKFAGWSGAEGLTFKNSTDAGDATIKFEMPNKDVTLTATYEIKKFTVAFNNSGYGTGTMASQTVEYGDYVLPNCTFTPNKGYKFQHWRIGYGATANPGDTIQITSDVTIYAIFEYDRDTEFNITVNNGTAKIASTPVTKAAQFNRITITASGVDGKVFSHWETTSEGVTFGNTNSESTYFDMPYNDVVVTAVYVDPHTHVGVKQDGKDATCTTDGWKDYYKCSCDALYADEACTTEIADLEAWKIGEGKIAAGHIYGDLKPAQEAIHTATVLKGAVDAHYFCDECDTYFDTNKNATTLDALTGDAPSHSGGTATCNAKAKCSTCGASYGEVNKNNHSALTTLKAVSATCSKTGLTEGKKCTACGVVTVAQKTVAKKAHTYQSVTTKATTSKNGSVVKKCSVCGSQASKTTIYYAKKIKLSTTEYTYNGKAKKPTVTVYDYKGNKISSSNYEVTYKDNKKVGKATVTVKFKGGKYSGSLKTTFTINPKKTTVSKLTAAKKSLKVKITKQSSQVTGYEIQYSTSKKFTKSTTKTKKVTSYKTTSVTLKSLKAKKTYYVRVRTYKTVNGKKYYSDWSSYKSKKTK